MRTRAGSTDGTVYTTYLFGQGAFAKGSAALDAAPLQGGFSSKVVEMARSALDSDTLPDQSPALSPASAGSEIHECRRGGRFAKPTRNSASNWTRVWENKNVRVVAVTHNN